MTYFSAVVTHNILYRFRGDEMMETVVQRHRTTLSTKKPKIMCSNFQVHTTWFCKSRFYLSGKTNLQPILSNKCYSSKMCCTFFLKNLQCCVIWSFSDSQKETETISNPMWGNLCTLSTEHPKVTFQGCQNTQPLGYDLLGSNYTGRTKYSTRRNRKLYWCQSHACANW